MGDLAGIPPFGGGGVNLRPFIDTTPAAVPAVEPSVGGQALTGRMSSGSQNAGGRSSDRQTAAHPVLQEPFDEHALPGPPPTFQVTLLEVDQHLMRTLARINAANGFRNSAIAAELPDQSGSAPTGRQDIGGDGGHRTNSNPSDRSGVEQTS